MKTISIDYIKVLILLLIYRRQLKRLEQYYDELSTPDVIDSEKQNIKTNTSGRKSEKDISNVLRHSKCSPFISINSLEYISILVVNSTPLEGARQVHLHHSFPLPTIDESLLVSSGSFEDSYTTNHHPMEKQSPTRTIISPMSESTGKMPLITPTHSTNIYSTRL